MSESASGFSKCSHDAFMSVADSTLDYDETQIDGRNVMTANVGGNCVGVFYSRAGFATVNPSFKGDLVAYCEQDPFWPYGN